MSLKSLFVRLWQIYKPVEPATELVKSESNKPVKIEPIKEITVVDPAIDAENHRIACFYHTRTRALERYKIEITRDIWEGWINQIESKAPQALFLGIEDKEGELWRVWFATRVVFVIFKNGMIRTALPIHPSYDFLVRKAIAKRKKELTTKKPVPVKLATSKPSHRIKTKLPPPHMRPKRNEEFLASLKENAKPPVLLNNKIKPKELD